MKLSPIDINREALEIIEKDFTGLYSGALTLSTIKGGQSAANLALNELDITRYADDRSQVLPREKRGATQLSPYIRHNLLILSQVYSAVKSAPFKDREKFRDELYWQEYARHLYARIGTRLFSNLRYESNWDSSGDGWNRDMHCIDTVVTELEEDGWLVNQTRMWLASHWTVRNEKGWLHGQERMYRNLLDGSRAANLLGWQWTVGAGTGKPYGFARWQVEKRAPGLCFKCSLKQNCPIQNFPDEITPHQLNKDPLLDHDPDLESTTGPLTARINSEPQYVLLTIDSLGDSDPALVAHPDLPVVFVFNAEALSKLQLSAARLGFYLQTLQDLSTRKNVTVYLGDPYEFATSNRVAITFAPVPSFNRFTQPAALYPYPWLIRPHSGSVRSFSSWRNAIKK